MIISDQYTYLFHLLSMYSEVFHKFAVASLPLMLSTKNVPPSIFVWVRMFRNSISVFTGC